MKEGQNLSEYLPIADPRALLERQVSSIHYIFSARATERRSKLIAIHFSEQELLLIEAWRVMNRMDADKMENDSFTTALRRLIGLGLLHEAWTS